MISVTETAERLGQHPRYIRSLLRHGLLRGNKQQRKNPPHSAWLVDPASVDERQEKERRQGAPVPPGYLSLVEAAQRAGVSRSKIYDCARKGLVRSHRAENIYQPNGFTWYVREADLQEYLDGQRVAGDPAIPPRVRQVGGEWAELHPGFRAYLLSQGLSLETVKTYLYNTTDYAEWCNWQGVSILKADRQLVERYYADQLQLSVASGSRRLMAIRALCRYLVAHGRMSVNPTEGLRVRKPKLQPRPPFTEEECRALLAATETRLERALLLTLIASGIRRAELLGMQVDDIDWGRGLALIHGKGMRERWIALGPAALGAIEEYLATRQSGPVWAGVAAPQMSRSALLRLLDGVAVRARVRNVYVHRFRVSFANMFLDAGGDLQSLQHLMGHANIEQTAHYSGFNASQRALDLQQRYNLADRLVKGEGYGNRDDGQPARSAQVSAQMADGAGPDHSPDAGR